MLGTRGCRLGIQWPEVYEMQVRDRARAKAVQERTGEAPLVEIMHPLVGFREELHRLRELTERVMEDERGARHSADDDRAAARRCSRRDRRGCGLLPSARTTSRRRRSACRVTTQREVLDLLSRGRCRSATRSRRSTRAASATSCASRSSAGAARSPRSSSASAASTAGAEVGRVCHRLGLDYVSCSPYRCSSRASPRRRPR